METTGSLSVLNVGIGDVRVVFNQHDSDERAKALRMLRDMQERGYAILVQLEDGSYTRAIEVDGSTGHYVVLEPETTVEAPKKRSYRRKRVPMAQAHAVGVARSAGG